MQYVIQIKLEPLCLEQEGGMEGLMKQTRFGSSSHFLPPAAELDYISQPPLLLGAAIKLSFVIEYENK